MRFFVKEIKDQLKAIDDKLEEHTKILSSVDKTLALQAQQLEVHMRRTAALEENVDILRQEFKPVQGHVDFINKLSKLIALIAAVSTAVLGAVELIRWIISL